MHSNNTFNILVLNDSSFDWNAYGLKDNKYDNFARY